MGPVATTDAVRRPEAVSAISPKTSPGPSGGGGGGLRAARAGSYAFGATVAIDGQPDTDPSNNAAELTVSVGPAPQAATCTVPNVRGRPRRRPVASILAAGCRPGATRTATSTTVPRGRVVRQAPAAGRRVARGTAVTLVVSRGP